MGGRVGGVVSGREGREREHSWSVEVRMMRKKEGKGDDKNLKDACVCGATALHSEEPYLQCMGLPFPWGSRHWGRGW